MEIKSVCFVKSCTPSPFHVRLLYMSLSLWQYGKHRDERTAIKPNNISITIVRVPHWEIPTALPFSHVRFICRA